jgi:uncharacterized protein (TIGR03083 family)
MRFLRDDVLGACLAGAEAIETIASRMSDDDWGRPTPCEEWVAADLLDHLHCIGEDYNRFLDCILDEHAGPLLTHQDIVAHNAARMAGLQPAAPLVRLAQFGLSARSFVTRLPLAWDRALFPIDDRVWTVGDYAAFCALEWHIHAWDLYSSVGVHYRPDCRGVLGAASGRWLPDLFRAGEDCWDVLLYASGRQPGLGLWREAV